MFRVFLHSRRIGFVLGLVLVGQIAQRSTCGQDANAPAGPLTLSRAVDMALRTNPATQTTAAGRMLAGAELREARSGRMPLLQASEAFTNSNNPVFVFGSLLEQGRFGAHNFAITSLNNPNPISNFRSALTVRLPLFDQRQTETRISQAKIGIKQADQKTDLVEQQLRFEVIRNYYGVLLSQSRVTVTDEAEKTAAADVKRARDLFETGVTVKSDLLAAQVQLAEFRQQRIQATAELATSIAALNTALGLSVTTPQILAGELGERSFTIDSLDVLSAQALQSRPDYQQAKSSIEATIAQTRGVRGEWLPRVDTYGTIGASTRYLVTSGSTDYAVGASITFNVFDAGRAARLEAARASESIAKAEAERMANQIRLEVVRAYHQYLSARERLAVVAEISAQATETLRIVQDRYHSGLTTITELLRAETALVRARTDMLAARYDQYVGYASLLLAAGRLENVSQFD